MIFLAFIAFKSPSTLARPAWQLGLELRYKSDREQYIRDRISCLESECALSGRGDSVDAAAQAHYVRGLNWFDHLKLTELLQVSVGEGEVLAIIHRRGDIQYLEKGIDPCNVVHLGRGSEDVCSRGAHRDGSKAIADAERRGRAERHSDIGSKGRQLSISTDH